MAEIARFMNSTEDDPRIYDAQDWDFAIQTILGSPYDSSRVGTGVSRYYKGSPSDQLLIVTANGSDMVTTVSVGSAVVYGKFYELTEPKQLVHEPADAELLRVDRVVLRLDNRIDKRTMSVEIKTGEPSNNRIPPALTWTNEIKEIALASVDIVPGRSYITQADVLDTRAYKEVCGFLPLHNILRGLEVDSNGISSQPNNPYVKIDANPFRQTIQDRTDTILRLRDGIVEDRQNEMRADVYLAKTTGVYDVFVYVAFDENYLPVGTDVQLSTFINGTYDAIISARTSSNAKDNIFSGAQIVDLNAGDELTISVNILGSLSSYTTRNIRVRIAKRF